MTMSRRMSKVALPISISMEDVALVGSEDEDVRLSDLEEREAFVPHHHSSVHSSMHVQSASLPKWSEPIEGSPSKRRRKTSGTVNSLHSRLRSRGGSGFIIDHQGGQRQGCFCTRWPRLTLLLGITVLLGVGIGMAAYQERSVINSVAEKALTYAGLKPPSSVAYWKNNTQSAYIYATSRPDLEPYEEHPIKVLMDRAKEEWEAKVAKQSKTYEEAIAEYQRRYGRSPPKGFDKWYEFALANDVPLIDEFDSIMHDLEPFFALSATQLITRTRKLIERPKPVHALIRVRNGKLLPHMGGTWRPAVTKNWEQMLANITQWLPDLNIPVFLHDGAHSSLDWEAKQGYLAASRAGTLVNESSLPIDGETAHTIRDRECAPDSRFRRVRTGVEQQYPIGRGPAFVNRHHAAMDYCNNPQFMQLHGAVATTWGLGELEPSFSMSRQEFNGDILWPAGILYELNPVNELPFMDKPVHKIVWRGSLDGIDVHPNNDWRSSHRYRLIAMSNSNDSTVERTLRVTKKDRWHREYQADVPTDLAELNERYTDMKPTGHPLQCDPELCDEIQSTTEWVPFATLEEMSQHRYVMDVDGNSYSARFRTHLLSNQVPLKSTVFAGWYSQRIQPWLHYVPTRVDYSDLYDILAYFDGDLTEERNGHHDEQAKFIAESGKEWAETHWRDVDMQAYTFRLLLEYGRLLETAREPRKQTGYALNANLF